MHPGETIAEWLEEQCMTQAELANRISMSAKALNQMIRGHAPVTPETSLRLEAVTGIPARAWNGLQALYAEDTARLQRDARLAAQVSFLDDIPVKVLRERGLVTARARDQVAVLRQVYDFFGVADAWANLWQSSAAAYRQSPAFRANPGAVTVWLRLGDLRALTLEPDAQTFVPEMSPICSEAGVTVVFVPDVQGSRCSGAARWIAGRPVIRLPLRHKSDDHLWFAFFHELGHRVLHGRHGVFIDDGTAATPAAQDIKDEADAFAQQALIPAEHAGELAGVSRLGDIQEFAQRIGVSPGVVVGRLQHDHLIGYQIGNKPKRRYAFATAR